MRKEYIVGCISLAIGAMLFASAWQQYNEGPYVLAIGFIVVGGAMFVPLTGSGTAAHTERFPTPQLPSTPVVPNEVSAPTVGADAGWVYVLINPSIPDQVKIGKTTRDVKARVAELSGVTGLPTAFAIAHSERFSDCVGLPCTWTQGITMRPDWPSNAGEPVRG